MQSHLRHPVFVQHADRFVDIAVDDELAYLREMQEPQHVAGGECRDERLLRIDARGGRHGLRDICWSRVAGHGDAVLEAERVLAAIGLVDERLPGAGPFSSSAMFAHILNTPKRVLSIGALREAESARPRSRRLSA